MLCNDKTITSAATKSLAWLMINRKEFESSLEHFAQLTVAVDHSCAIIFICPDITQNGVKMEQ